MDWPSPLRILKCEGGVRLLFRYTSHANRPSILASDIVIAKCLGRLPCVEDIFWGGCIPVGRALVCYCLWRLQRDSSPTCPGFAGILPRRLLSPLCPRLKHEARVQLGTVTGSQPALSGRAQSRRHTGARFGAPRDSGISYCCCFRVPAVPSFPPITRGSCNRVRTASGVTPVADETPEDDFVFGIESVKILPELFPAPLSFPKQPPSWLFPRVLAAVSLPFSPQFMSPLQISVHEEPGPLSPQDLQMVICFRVSERRIGGGPSILLIAPGASVFFRNGFCVACHNHQPSWDGHVLVPVRDLECEYSSFI